MGQALVGAWRQQCLDREQWRWCQDGKEDVFWSKNLGSYDLVTKENITKVVTSAVFACVGTAGQRCTTLRRLIVHEDLYDEVSSGPYCHVPICPHNSPIHPLEGIFYPHKTSISQYIVVRCWRSWKSLMPRLWADWEILLTMAHSTGPFTAKWLSTSTILHLFLAAFVF